MPDAPQNILSQLVTNPHEKRLRQAYLTAVDLADDEVLPWSNGSESNAIAFQYWPEGIQDTRASNWTPRNIPGGSHPIYQWTSGGERQVSFTAVFTTDTDPGDVALEDSTTNTPLGLPGDPYRPFKDNLLSGVQMGTRDLDLRSAVSWLRYFTYPLYGQGEDLRVFEPPKVQLHMPNSRIGYDGADYMLCVMLQCDVTYEAFFPNGFPRIVEVALQFAEVVQQRSGVRFHDRRRMTASIGIGQIEALNPQSGSGAS